MRIEAAPTPSRTKIVLPKGKYIIGDPCYTIPDHLWMTWLETGDFRNSDPDHIVAAKIDGLLAIGISTAHGDGCYKDQQGIHYLVDAGMIGAVPKKLFGNPSPNLTHEMMFDTDFECYYSNGKIYFGNLVIDTDEEDWDAEWHF